MILSNYEWLLKILTKSSGGEIPVESNGLVNIDKVVQQISTKVVENGGTFVPSGAGGGWRPVADNYEPIAGEYAYIRSVENENNIYINATEYRFSAWLQYLDYSYNQVDWLPATELSTITLNKNQKIYFKNNGSGVLSSNTTKKGTVASDKGIALGGNFGKLISANNSTFSLHKFFACKGTESDDKLVTVDKYSEFGTTGGGQEFCLNDKYLANFNAQNLTLGNGDMAFKGCKSLKYIADLNYSSGFSLMANMFEGCENLVAIPTNINFSKITNISSCFKNCKSLKALNLNGLTKATSFVHTFNGCKSLSAITGEYSTAKVTNFSQAFREVGGDFAVTLDLTSITNGERLYYCFENSNVGKTDGITFTNIPTGLTNIGSHIFNGCKLSELKGDLSNFNTIQSFSCWFWGCENLRKYPTTLAVDSGLYFDRFLNGCTHLDCTTLPAEMNTHNGTDFRYTFEACGRDSENPLITAPILHTENGTAFTCMFNECYYLETIPLINLSNANGCEGIFGGCDNLKNITFEGRLNCGLSIPATVTYDTIKSALVAASNADGGVAAQGHGLGFSGAIVTDRNGEIAALVDTCVAMGWNIADLIIN